MDKTYIPAYVLEPAKLAPAAHVFVERAPMPGFIKDIEAGRVQLPTIKRIVLRVIDALNAPKVDLHNISKDIARDPILSAQVLRVANSPLFGGQRSTASIEAAVALLGAETLRKLVENSVAATELAPIEGLDLRAFWHNALVTAVAANKLSPLVKADPNEAYLCGLLHSVGHLILCRCHAGIADAMFGGFQMMRDAELAGVEQDAFGIDHAAAGALWMDSLDFPQHLIEVVRTQLTTPADQLDPLALALRSGRLLATAVARQATPVAALSALAPEFCARFIDDTGQLDSGFTKFYAALREIKAKG